MTRSRILIAVAVLASLAGGIQGASAADIAARPWVMHHGDHPHHARMLHREPVQLARIHHERAPGRSSGGQPHAPVAQSHDLHRQTDLKAGPLATDKRL